MFKHAKGSSLLGNSPLSIDIESITLQFRILKYLSKIVEYLVKIDENWSKM